MFINGIQNLYSEKKNIIKKFSKQFHPVFVENVRFTTSCFRLKRIIHIKNLLHTAEFTLNMTKDSLF